MDLNSAALPWCDNFRTDSRADVAVTFGSCFICSIARTVEAQALCHTAQKSVKGHKIIFPQEGLDSSFSALNKVMLTDGICVR